MVSPQLLRLRDMGQIDLSRLKKDKDGWVLEVAEVKSSDMGEEMLLRGQRARLFSAQKFLAAMFGVRTKFIRLKIIPQRNSAP